VVSTESGTARHGAYLGFIPVTAQDAIDSFDQQIHKRMLGIRRRMLDIETTATIIKNIESQREGRGQVELPANLFEA
jgi:hypothetical protein